MADRGVNDLWLGEAPSRFGARRTGVPFTGDGRLADLSERLGLDPPLARATRGTLPTLESGTSREIWNAVPDPLPLFWNAVLFHPHRGVLPLRNRTPTRTEIAEHREVLEMIVAIFAPHRILCIGRVAQRARGRARHPRHLRAPPRAGRRRAVPGRRRRVLRILSHWLTPSANDQAVSFDGLRQYVFARYSTIAFASASSIGA